VSIISLVLMVILFISELGDFLSIRTSEHIVVDTRPGQDLKINFNFTFFALRCTEVHIDVMDVSGEQQVDVYQDTYRQRLSPLGVPVGSPFKESHNGAPTPDEYGEGCILWGFLSVSKVQGNMHVALGQSSGQNTRHVHQFRLQDLMRFNASHHITYLAFGELYPGVINPLDDVTRIIAKENGAAVHFQYFIKVVPTKYTEVNGKILETNQFSVTEEAQQVSTSDVLAASQKNSWCFLLL